MKSLIHHIVLTVTDPKRSGEFYQQVLGWSIVEQEADHVCLSPDSKQYGGTTFMLILGKPRDHESPKASFDRNAIGLDHFAFSVDSEEELKQVEKRLNEYGIKMEEGGITDDDFGGTAIFCTDPDGMKVEFHLNKK